MVQLRLGNIDNRERKFIPTKREFLEAYLNSLEKIEEYELIQTFSDGYKYRCYNDNGICKYTKNKKMGSITKVVEIDKKTFDEVLNSTNKCIKKVRKYYNDLAYEIDVDYFSAPLDLVLVGVACIGNDSLDNYKAPRGFIDITGNPIYDNSNIINGSIINSKTIIEGTDGVGKSTTIEALLKEGIICQNRSMDMISINMEFDIPLEVRAKKYHEYLKHIDKKIIILVNNDKEELERRINLRPTISKFDKLAYAYNGLYLETFNYMLKHDMLEGKMFLVDATGLSIES